jgi:predicted transcriptional regulator YdeE
MKNTIVNKDTFNIIGISARTTNLNEISGHGEIPKLWNRFYTEGIAHKIPGKISRGEIIAAYTDFTSDENGEYTIIIGCETEPDIIPPEGMIGKKINKCNYLQISTEWGSLQKIGVAAWMKIWQDQPLKSQRVYRADLEIYGKDAANPEMARFDILLSLK